MKVINATTIGNLISAHYEKDDKKFDSYVRFIIEAYEEQGESRKVNIIRKRMDGSYKNEPQVTLDDRSELQLHRGVNRGVTEITSHNTISFDQQRILRDSCYGIQDRL